MDPICFRRAGNYPYLITRRIKPGEEKTAAMLEVFHNMLVIAMK